MVPPDRMIAAFLIAGIVVFLLGRFLIHTQHLQLPSVTSTANGQLIPEGLYTVVVTDETVSYEDPDGTIESIGWNELRRVEVVTTDQGPFLPDSFWVLTGSETQCTIAQGAKGENLLLDRLQSLSGFDNEGLISAMGSTTNARFLCWDKDKRG